MVALNFSTEILSAAAEAAAIQARYARREAGVVRRVRGLSEQEHHQVLQADAIARRLERAAKSHA